MQCLKGSPDIYYIFLKGQDVDFTIIAPKLICGFQHSSVFKVSKINCYIIKTPLYDTGNSGVQRQNDPKIINFPQMITCSYTPLRPSLILVLHSTL